MWYFENNNKLLCKEGLFGRLNTNEFDYSTSSTYTAYNRYIEGGLKKDIFQYLIPALNNIQSTSKCINYVPHDDIVSVKNDTFVSYQNQTSYKAMMVLKAVGAVGATYTSKTFEFLNLPAVSENGVLEYRGKKYSVINHLRQDDADAYSESGKSLKLTYNENSITLCADKSRPYVKIFRYNPNLINTAGMLVNINDDVNNVIKFLNSITESHISDLVSKSSYNDTMKGLEPLTISHNIESLGLLNTEDPVVMEKQIISETSTGGMIFANEDMKPDLLNVSDIRHRIDKLCSLDRAIGRENVFDISLANGDIIRAGKILTLADIDKLRASRINNVKVRSGFVVPDDYVLMETFLISRIKSSIRIDDNFIEEIGLPDVSMQSLLNFGFSQGDADKLRKAYTEKTIGDIVLDNGILLSPGTRLTDTILELLECNLIYEITVSKQGSQTTKVITSYRNIVSNYRFTTDGCSKLIIDNKEVDYGDNLTPYDLISLFTVLIGFNEGYCLELAVDADLGLRKRIEEIDAHFSRAFKYAVKSFIKRTPNKKLEKFGLPSTLENGQLLYDTFRFFSKDFWRHLYLDMKVIVPLDITNPIATASSLTKVNAPVKDSKSISDSRRRMSISHYGRLCPYETPQSGKLGVVNNLASKCKVIDGKMCTPYRKVIVTDNNVRLSMDIEYFDVEKEETIRSSDLAYLQLEKHTLNILNPDDLVLAKIPTYGELENLTFRNIKIRDLEYVNAYYNQTVSDAGTTVPFIGSNDAVRVIFGLAMVKQTKSLVNPEIPRVCTTGFYDIVNNNNYYLQRAEGYGIVKDIDVSAVHVEYSKEDIEKYNIKCSPDGIATYKYNPVEISADSVILRNITVTKGQRVFRGTTLITSNHVKDNFMAIGVNALVTYIPDGYNYEDADVISERLATKLTSYGAHREEELLNKEWSQIIPADVDNFKYLKQGDVACNIKYKYPSKVKGSSQKLSGLKKFKCIKSKGFIVNFEKEYDTENPNVATGLTLSTVSLDKVMTPDKLSNRHGNKGTTPPVRKNSEMRYLDNGECIDIVYNQHGIISRMNLGQVLEAHAGLACHVLDIRVFMEAFNDLSLKDVKRLLCYAYEVANSNDSTLESILGKYKEYPEGLHRHVRENIDTIRFWANTFDENGEAYLTDPLSGARTYKKVLVGVNYVHKLVQEGYGKLHTRGGYLTSAYVAKKSAPTQGAKKQGGQRVGHMEISALSAYGASAYLSELMNERGDNAVARNNVTVDTLHSGLTNCKLEGKGMRRATERFISMLEALGIQTISDGSELDLKNTDNRRGYTLAHLQKVELGKTQGVKDDAQRHEEAIKLLLSKKGN